MYGIVVTVAGPNVDVGGGGDGVDSDGVAGD